MAKKKKTVATASVSPKMARAVLNRLVFGRSRGDAMIRIYVARKGERTLVEIERMGSHG